jgi:hypothetical protein
MTLTLSDALLRFYLALNILEILSSDARLDDAKETLLSPTWFAIVWYDNKHTQWSEDIVASMTIKTAG